LSYSSMISWMLHLWTNKYFFYKNTWHNFKYDKTYNTKSPIFPCVWQKLFSKLSCNQCFMPMELHNAHWGKWLFYIFVINWVAISMNQWLNKLKKTLDITSSMTKLAWSILISYMGNIWQISDLKYLLTVTKIFQS